MTSNKMILWAVALLALILLVFARPVRSGSVTGSVNPRGSALQVWLYNVTDTLRSNIQDDIIEIGGVKAGTYTLVVEPAANYKTNTRSGIKVNDGEVTNVGEIIMESVKK
jgi:hypothetical protein